MFYDEDCEFEDEQLVAGIIRDGFLSTSHSIADLYGNSERYLNGKSIRAKLKVDKAAKKPPKQHDRQVRPKKKKIPLPKQSAIQIPKFAAITKLPEFDPRSTYDHQEFIRQATNRGLPEVAGTQEVFWMINHPIQKKD